MSGRWRMLVVDDEEAMTETLAAWLCEDGFGVDAVASGREAIEKARARAYAIYFVGLELPGGLDGIETMLEIRKLRQEASVVIVTADANADVAIAAMKQGAQEYLVKPCRPPEISLLVERIIRIKKLQRENAILRRKLTRQHHFHDMLGRSTRMARIVDLPSGLTLQELEREYIRATLARLQGNVKGASESLGIDRSTLYEKIKRYEIPR